ncbi:MAG: hypothetical protein LC648_10655, partial [Novosphingobium sp.]|nr:hypothetical protein [Novosphingobium sp.]
LPLPALPGAHQADNAALAVAMLRHQSLLTVSPEAMAAAIRTARWPARLQLLGLGPLTALVPGRRVWLDGGHNADAGRAIAEFIRRAWPSTSSGRADASQDATPARAELVEARRTALHLIVGMLANKDPEAIVGPLRPLLASLTVVPVPSSEHHPPAAFGPDAKSARDVATALAALPSDGVDVLIAGSLYLAGAVLAANGEIPD